VKSLEWVAPPGGVPAAGGVGVRLDPAGAAATIGGQRSLEVGFPIGFEGRRVSDALGHERRYPRIAAESVALVSSVSTPEAEALAKTRTLGLGGCGFVTDAALAVGDTVQLLLSLSGRAISARARVVYVVPLEGRSEVGVEFVEVDPGDRAFLLSRLPEPPAAG
jgi:Tfp pilus assembly protein PilZ